ncbi:MAG TPA: ROK family protein [Clostridia bacterium]|nr:ROK family protein [Clostridia bacterium]
MAERVGSDPDDIVLGLDVGGTKLAAGVVTGDGRVLGKRSAASFVGQGPHAMIDRHVALGRAAVEASGVPWSRVRAVGIACGGPLDPFHGIIQSPPGLPGWDDIPLVDIVERALERPAVVDNDATACALAEDWYGAGRARGVRHLVYLTISTGVGGGLVLDGRLYRGAAGNAGELGHLTVDYRGRQCGCGRRGCLEAYASGTNIAARAREALATGRPSSRAELPEVTARDVAAAAAAGDPLASEVWDETTAILGSAIANILDVFNPELVVLGGGVTRAGDQLLVPVREAALRQAMAPARGAADIVLAGLGEDLGVVSAAAVAFERLPREGRAALPAVPAAGARPRPAPIVGSGRPIVVTGDETGDGG